jgi:hypothetical protein
MITIDGSQGEGGAQILRFGGCLRNSHYDSQSGFVTIPGHDTIWDEGFGIPEGGIHTILVWPDDDLMAVSEEPRPKHKGGSSSVLLPKPRQGHAVDQLAAALLASPLVSGICRSGADHFELEIVETASLSRSLETACGDPLTEIGLTALLTAEAWRKDEAWEVLPRVSALSSARSTAVVDLGKVLIPLGNDCGIGVVSCGTVGPFARGFSYRLSADSYAQHLQGLARRIPEPLHHLITRRLHS